MPEYIEREAVIKHLRECEGTPPEIGYTYPIFKAIECFVEGVPSADVVEVVRCKECKHRTLDFFGGHCCRLHKGLAMITDDSFCSYGERKDNESMVSEREE